MFPIETISAKMLDYYVDRPDTLIIDLREPESYRKSHIRGAVNIPYEELSESPPLPKEKLLIFYFFNDIIQKYRLHFMCV